MTHEYLRNWAGRSMLTNPCR